MAIGRRVVALCSAAALVCSGTLLAQQVKKLSDAQRREVQEIVKIIDSAAAASTAPNDLSLTWAREDFLKAQGNQEYVPFTVMIDPSKVSGNNVTIYWRVVAKTAAPARGSGSRRRPREATRIARRLPNLSLRTRTSGRRLCSPRTVRSPSAVRLPWPPGRTK